MCNLNNFGLAYPFVEDYKDSSFGDYKGSVIESDKVLPVVIEGSEIFDTLVPVSKFTGRRENPLSLLSKISGADSALLNSVLQELPSVASDSRLTDEDRANWLVSRLSTGTPAEDAMMAKYIMNDLEALGLKSREAVKVVDDSSKINFDDTETLGTNETV